MWIAISNAIGSRQGVGGGPGPSPGYTPPLDSVTAAVAYSVRKLSSSYSGDCMLVRRVSDGATQGIGFDADGLIDVNALATFSGGSELTVKTWYDQAGGGFDLEQPNDAYLPTIYDGSAVTTSTSGKPCVRIVRVSNSGPGEWLITDPVSLSTAGDMDVFLVLHGPLTGGGDRRFWDSNAGPTTSGQRFSIDYGSNTYRANGQGVSLSTSVQGNSVPIPNGLQFIHNTRYYSNLEIYGNGVEFGSLVSTNTSRTDPYNVALGARVIGTEGYSTFDISEIIHLPNYGVSNNESINLNINDYYQFTNLPYYSSGLLADYPGAAAAYSVRSLSNTAIKCMRVRRTVSPFDEQDIGFDSNGDLDTAAIAAFGGSDPLAVSAWYDQSGQSNHATQGTAGRQPTIYDGAEVITENGKPALDFDGTDDLMDSPTMTVTDGEFMQTAVYTLDVNKANSAVATTDTSPVRVAQTIQFPDTTNVRLLTFNSSGGIDAIITATTTSAGTQTLATSHVLNGQGEVFVNGAGALTGTVNVRTDQTTIRLGNNLPANSALDGRIQEVIHWPSEQTQRTNIESDLNTYYSIY